MQTYEPKGFALPEIPGISAKQIDAHLALYQGYVKHANLVREKIAALTEADAAGNAYLISELRRRYAFEFSGMRLHELYFEQLERAVPADPSGKLAAKAVEKYGSWDAFVLHVKEVAMTRGTGWTLVTYDPVADTLHTAYAADHEMNHLATLPVVLALDMWEHAYMVDYLPAEKKSYIDAFFAALDWSVIEKRLPLP